MVVVNQDQNPVFQLPGQCCPVFEQFHFEHTPNPLTHQDSACLIIPPLRHLTSSVTNQPCRLSTNPLSSPNPPASQTHPSLTPCLKPSPQTLRLLYSGGGLCHHSNWRHSNRPAATRGEELLVVQFFFCICFPYRFPRLMSEFESLVRKLHRQQGEKEPVSRLTVHPPMAAQGNLTLNQPAPFRIGQSLDMPANHWAKMDSLLMPINVKINLLIQRFCTALTNRETERG